MGSADRDAGGRPTLEAVARHAGVSRGTVSRVINDSPRVSETARAAVAAAIEELGYVPNRAARMLVTRRTDTVALIVSESQDRLFAEPFFAGVLRGVTAALGDTEVQLLLAMAQSAAERARLRRYLSGQHVDGVMVLSSHADDPLPGELTAAGVPLVFGGRPATGGFYVDADNRDGARQAVAHLVAAGRRRIATIAGPPDMSPGVDRLRGYRDALAAAGLDADDTLVATGDFSEDSGRAAMGTLLDRRPDLDAVFAASDPMALGAVRRLREHGARVPEDVAVVGFDDSETGRHTDPPLTSVHQPLGELGGRMAEMLLSRIAGDSPEPVILPTRLVVRASG